MAYLLNYITHTNNKARQAALFAGDLDNDQSDSNYPVSNMVELPVSKKGRIKNIYGPMELQVSFPGATAIDTIALVGHNLSDSATVTVYGGSSFDPTTSLGTITWRKGTMFVKFSATQSYQYYKIEIDDDANDYGFASIGYLVMGEASTLSFGYSGYQFVNRKLGVRRSSEFGTPLYQHLSEGEDLRLYFRNRTQSEADALVDLFHDLIGPNEPALWIPNASANECTFGRFADDELVREYVPAYPPLVDVTVYIRGDNYGRDVVESLPKLVAGESLPSGWTFTRSSKAYYKNRDLLLVQAAVDECRTAHYVLPGRPAVLLEDSSTNLLRYSEELDNAAWLLYKATIVADQADEPTTNPIGKMDKIVSSTDGGSHNISQRVQITANAMLAGSIYAKAGEKTWLYILVRGDPTTNQFGSYFNLENGHVGSTVRGGTGTLSHAYIEQMADGTYRCVVAGSIGGDSTSAELLVTIAVADKTYSHIGDGTSGLYLWGAQLEESETATSYIKTTSAAASRSIDSLTRVISLPVQPVTRYVKMIEMGEAFGSGLGGVSRFTTALGGYFSSAIGLSSSKVVCTSTQDVLGGQYISVDSNIDSIQPLNTLEFCSSLLPDRRVSTEVSINGGASASQTGSIGPQFSYNYVWNQLEVFNSGAKRRPLLAIERLVHARGVHSIEEMRRR